MMKIIIILCYTNSSEISIMEFDDHGKMHSNNSHGLQVMCACLSSSHCIWKQIICLDWGASYMCTELLFLFLLHTQYFHGLSFLSMWWVSLDYQPNSHPSTYVFHCSGMEAGDGKNKSERAHRSGWASDGSQMQIPYKLLLWTKQV